MVRPGRTTAPFWFNNRVTPLCWGLYRDHRFLPASGTAPAQSDQISAGGPCNQEFLVTLTTPTTYVKHNNVTEHRVGRALCVSVV